GEDPPGLGELDAHRVGRGAEQVAEPGVPEPGVANARNGDEQERDQLQPHEPGDHLSPPSRPPSSPGPTVGSGFWFFGGFGEADVGAGGTAPGSGSRSPCPSSGKSGGAGLVGPSSGPRSCDVGGSI